MGWKVTETQVMSQKIEIQDSVKTLNDLQKLFGTINLIRPKSGITTKDLNDLFDLLKGDPSLSSPWTLTSDVICSLNLITSKIQTSYARHKQISLTLHGFIINSSYQPFDILGQWDGKQAYWNGNFFPINQ